MLYRTTDKPEATEIVIIDSQIDYRGKLDTYIQIFEIFRFFDHGYYIIAQLFDLNQRRREAEPGVKKNVCGRDAGYFGITK